MAFAVGSTKRGKGIKVMAFAFDDVLFATYLSNALYLPSANLWKLSWLDASSRSYTKD